MRRTASASPAEAFEPSVGRAASLLANVPAAIAISHAWVAYLNGDAEGHDVLDAVTAARLADRTIADDVAIAGHSQGGQAALFAASLAPKYAPGALGN